VESLLRLQRLAGNRAVSSLVAVQRDVEEEGKLGARPNLDEGDSGPGVRLLQRRLTELGYPVPVTGTFGRRTHSAVVAFQSVRPALLPATGGVGPLTWNAIDSEGDAGIGSPTINTEGSGVLGLQLGYHSAGTFYINGVEISFPLGPGAVSRFGGLVLRQWSGPEGEYLQGRDDAGDTGWVTLSEDQGSGADDPLPRFQRIRTDAAVYYDSPGPDLSSIAFKNPNFSRVCAIQNFTGWLESGATGQRVSAVISWHSVVDVSRVGSTFQMTPTPHTRAGRGWAQVAPPP
jgi:hypothetical protein